MRRVGAAHSCSPDAHQAVDMHVTVRALLFVGTARFIVGACDPVPSEDRWQFR